MKMQNVMIDIETLGTKPGCVILSIGAVRFDIKTGKIGSKFYKKIDLNDSMNHGFSIDSNTLKWWIEKSKEVQDEAFFGKTKLVDAIKHLINFLNKDDILWANSPSFDLNILEYTYKTLFKDPIMGLKLNKYYWNPFNQRDVRTIASIDDFKTKKSILKKNHDKVLHNPIDDCLIQIEYIVDLINK